MEEYSIALHKTLFESRKEVEGVLATGKLSKVDCNVVRSHLESLTEAITGLLLKNSVLRSEILDLKLKASTVTTPSYAQATANKLKTTPPRPEHVLILEKSESASGDVNPKELVTKNLNPQKLKIGIRKARETKGGGFIMEVNSAEELENLKKAIDSSKNLKTNLKYRAPRKLDPKIIIFGVDEGLSGDEVVKAIQEQNGLEEVVVLHAGSFKGKGGINHIMEIDGKSFHKINQLDKIYINWERYNFKEYIKPRQCFKCLNFGHTAKFCKSETDTCYKCNGSGHQGRECKHTEVCCALCTKFNLKQGNPKNKLKTDHMANSRKCPQFLKEIDRVKSFINYG